MTNGIFFSPNQWRIPAQPELPGRGAASLLPQVSAGGRRARGSCSPGERGSCSPGGRSRQVLLVRRSVRVAAGLPGRPLKVAEREARCPAEAAGRSWSVRFVSRALRSAGAAWGQLSRCRRWPPRLMRTRRLENLHPGPSRCWAPRRWGRGLCGLQAHAHPRGTGLHVQPLYQSLAVPVPPETAPAHRTPSRGSPFLRRVAIPLTGSSLGARQRHGVEGTGPPALGRRAGRPPGEGGEQTRREGRRIFWSWCLAALRVRAGAAAR